MKSDNPNRAPATVAAIAAGLLMLVFGTTYRVLEARLAAPVNRTPINPAALERFPLQIAGWTGQDIPLDDAVVRATGTDARINRGYSRHNGLESVSLYVACGANARGLMVHRPEVCYIGAGWTLLDRRSMELSLADGTKLPCSIFEFSRGGLDARRMTVLNYFIVDGQHCGDASLLRSRAWRGSGTVSYVVQVQIAASQETTTGGSATTLVCAFAVDSASFIAQLFEDLEKDRNLGEIRELPKGK